jgi:hypothetical protein
MTSKQQQQRLTIAAPEINIKHTCRPPPYMITRTPSIGRLCNHTLERVFPWPPVHLFRVAPCLCTRQGVALVTHLCLLLSA